MPRNLEPCSPVLPNCHADYKEVVFAKGQRQYKPLPAVRDSTMRGKVTTRWRFTWRDRLRVLFRGSIWLQQLTFSDSLQPVKLTVYEPPAEDALGWKQDAKT